MDRKVIWGLRRKEILAVLIFYFVFATLYYVAIWITSGMRGEFFDLVSYIDSCGLQYVIFLLFTIPIWYLIFKQLRSISLYKRLLIHIVTLPIFIFGTQQVYYSIADAVDFGHLEGSGSVWDIYIPALLYLVQFGIFHAYEYYNVAQQKLRMEGELRQAALKSELAAIKAQLNPHFLYNVFNTINASVPPKQEKTRQLIATLADLFRYQLKASKKELVPLSDEIEFVNKYLELEKARFEERLEIEMNVPKALLGEMVPPMLLQPLVENSVKHGISNTLKGGKISISIFKEGEKLKFEIADTGKGVKDKKSLFGRGVGLSNTQLRLQKMYQSQLEILDNTPQGLKICFAL
ncbi:histidine kinase [Muricauda sp. SCSIO 64092]|uniref:sensor histidine kinase n=1 Tax=Allomuricauda sp. SCSIO 64092 TaxID=2908842 RepID=UPI001FF3A8C8|nr:histidine kinase [Muricauda sp. SCSIO 64092]UOY05402.1 histidine kinase [Muricauda sp. SCSIO 64092]